MKNLKILGFLAVIALLASSYGCKKTNPEPQKECIEGVVIAEQYNRITGTGMSACAPVVQIKNRAIGKVWVGINADGSTTTFENCVTMAVPAEFGVGQSIYFESFTVVEGEYGPWLTDCLPPPNFQIITQNLSANCNQNK